MVFAALRRAILLLVLGALGVGGYIAYKRVHAASPASLEQARSDVAAAGGASDGRPAAGVYRYTQKGSQRLPVGPLSVTRTLPATALLVVSKGPGGSTLLDWRFGADVGESLAVQAAGSGAQRLVSRTVSLDMPVVGFDVGGATQAAAWRPPKPKVGPLPPVTYEIGGVVVRREARVVRKESIEIGGQPVTAWVIQAREDLTGSVNGDISETAWWAPSLGLDVRRSVEFALAGAVAGRIRSNVTLESVLPERP